MSIWQRSSGPRSSGVKNRISLFAVLGLMLTAALLMSLCFGSTELDFGKVLTAISEKNYSDGDFRILFYLRLPRVLAAVLAGSALAVSGVLIQAVLSNPMAAPNVIGVNSGAGLAAALTIAVFPGALTLLPLSSFAGALAACLLIYGISVKTGASKLTVTLVGIAVGSVLNAGINTVKVLFPDSVYDAELFMIGGFSGVTFGKIMPGAVIILVGLAAAFVLGRDTDILSLGENIALSLGLNVRLLKFALLITASALAGAAVSFSGLLGFVGLLVPHIMRKFTGSRQRLLIPAAALAGSILVLVCDLFSRTAFAPYELPVGIVLSLVGGLFFIGLVLFMKRGDRL